MSNEMPHDSLNNFLDGLERHARSDDSPVARDLSDRDLAAIAWPDSESWSDLSPDECEEAIDRHL